MPDDDEKRIEKRNEPELPVVPTESEVARAIIWRLGTTGLGTTALCAAIICVSTPENMLMSLVGPLIIAGIALGGHAAVLVRAQKESLATERRTLQQSIAANQMHREILSISNKERRSVFEAETGKAFLALVAFEHQVRLMQGRGGLRAELDRRIAQVSSAAETQLATGLQCDDEDTRRRAWLNHQLLLLGTKDPRKAIRVLRVFREKNDEAVHVAEAMADAARAMLNKVPQADGAPEADEEPAREAPPAQLPQEDQS